MCGRLNQTGEIKWRDFVTSIRLKPVYNAAPTETLSLIRSDRVEPARWWLVPSWAKEISTKYSMFNARSENLTSSKAFRVPFQRQRGIVPISSFIEWRGQKSGKQPWLVTNEQHCFYAAALWDVWTGDDLPLLSCTIVTTEAAQPFTPWHHRMPVMLGEGEVERWLDNTVQIPANDPVFRPQLKEPWHLSPLDKAVGNSRQKSPELMNPIGEILTLSCQV